MKETTEGRVHGAWRVGLLHHGPRARPACVRSRARSCALVAVGRQVVEAQGVDQDEEDVRALARRSGERRDADRPPGHQVGVPVLRRETVQGGVELQGHLSAGPAGEVGREDRASGALPLVRRAPRRAPRSSPSSPRTTHARSPRITFQASGQQLHPGVQPARPGTRPCQRPGRRSWSAPPGAAPRRTSRRRSPGASGNQRPAAGHRGSSRRRRREREAPGRIGPSRRAAGAPPASSRQQRALERSLKRPSSRAAPTGWYRKSGQRPIAPVLQERQRSASTSQSMRDGIRRSD